MGMGRMGRDNEQLPPGKLKLGHLGRIAAYLKPYLWHTAVIFLCIGAATAIGLAPPLVIRAIIDKALPTHNKRLLNLLVLAMIVVPAVNGLIGVIQNYFNTRVGQAIMFDLRNQLFAHLQRMSLRFYVATQTGQIMSRVNNDVGAVQNAVTGTLVGIVTSTVTVASTLAVIFALNAHLALLAVVILPAFVAPMRSVGRFPAAHLQADAAAAGGPHRPHGGASFDQWLHPDARVWSPGRRTSAVRHDQQGSHGLADSPGNGGPLVLHAYGGALSGRAGADLLVWWSPGH